MINPFYRKMLPIVFCFTFALTSCAQTQNNKSKHSLANTKSIQIDTSKTAIILFNKKWKYPFDNSFNPTTLTQDDLNIIDSLLVICVENYNNSVGKSNLLSIDLKKDNYRKQLIAVTNSKGEKEVWVNCFCVYWSGDKWKAEIILVEDGGSCYFNFKINLSTKKFYDLIVNGIA